MLETVSRRYVVFAFLGTQTFPLDMYFSFQRLQRRNLEVNVCDDIDIHQQKSKFMRLVGARHQIRDTKKLSEIIVLGSTIAAIRFQDASCASDAHDGGPAPGGRGLHDPDHELAAGVQPSHLRPLRICTNPNSWRSITIWTRFSVTSQWLDFHQMFASSRPDHSCIASKCHHVLDVMFLCFARVATREGHVPRLTASREARAVDPRRTAFAIGDVHCWRLPAARRHRDATGPEDQTAQRSTII